MYMTEKYRPEPGLEPRVSRYTYTSALPTELPSLHNSVIQISGFLLTTPASMLSSYVSPLGRVAGVRAGTCMFATCMQTIFCFQISTIGLVNVIILFLPL